MLLVQTAEPLLHSLGSVVPFETPSRLQVMNSGCPSAVAGSPSTLMTTNEKEMRIASTAFGMARRAGGAGGATVVVSSCATGKPTNMCSAAAPEEDCAAKTVALRSIPYVRSASSRVASSKGVAAAYIKQSQSRVRCCLASTRQRQAGRTVEAVGGAGQYGGCSSKREHASQSIPAKNSWRLMALGSDWLRDGSLPHPIRTVGLVLRSYEGDSRLV